MDKADRIAQCKRALSGTFDPLLPTVAVAAALLVGAMMLVALGVNPLVAYGAMLEGAVGSAFGLTQTLMKATPPQLVGLGITIAFRGGVINIGGESQLMMGARATTALRLALPELSPFALGLLAGALAGGVWGGILGLLKARLGVNEIVSAILMNQIAIQLAYLLLRGPMIDLEVVAVGRRCSSRPSRRAAWTSAQPSTSISACSSSAGPERRRCSSQKTSTRSALSRIAWP
jgi:simple sugar transport system permease protein